MMPVGRRGDSWFSATEWRLSDIATKGPVADAVRTAGGEHL